MLKFLFNLEFLIISHPVDQQNKNFGQKKNEISNSTPPFRIFTCFNLFQDKFKINYCNQLVQIRSQNYVILTSYY